MQLDLRSKRRLLVNSAPPTFGKMIEPAGKMNAPNLVAVALDTVLSVISIHTSFPRSSHVRNLEERDPEVLPSLFCYGKTCTALEPSNPFQWHNLPMLRHFPQPLHAGGLEADVGIEAARDGAVDDGLLLLLQQRDQLLLGADVAPDAPVGVVEEADDCGLFG